MQEKDDSAWVFDSLIGFLQGPIWSSPLMTFIEENSLSKKIIYYLSQKKKIIFLIFFHL